MDLQKAFSTVYQDCPFNAFAKILRYEGQFLSEKVGGNCFDQANFLARLIAGEKTEGEINILRAEFVAHVSLVFIDEDRKAWYLDPFLQQRGSLEITSFIAGEEGGVAEALAYPYFQGVESRIFFKSDKERLEVGVLRRGGSSEEWSLKHRYFYRSGALRKYEELRTQGRDVYYLRPFVSLRLVDEEIGCVYRVMFRTKEQILSVGLIGEKGNNFDLNDGAILEDRIFSLCARRLGLKSPDLREMVLRAVEFYKLNSVLCDDD